MTKKMNVLELPLYRDYFDMFLEIITELEILIESNSKHKNLILKTYENAIEIFPTLNAGYNYWGSKGKLQIYNKVRILLSEFQSRIHILFELKILKKDYFEEIENSITYVGGLIKKIETFPS